MSNYTLEIRQIIESGENVFDFNYIRDPKSIAILSNEELEKGFLRHFFFREIGQETVERFKYMLETQWKESLGEFDKWLIAYNDPINVKANYSNKGTNTAVSNDTPMSALDFGEQSKHASFIQHNNAKAEGYNGTTEAELLEKFHQNTRDIQTEFYESFDNLFMQIF